LVDALLLAARVQGLLHPAPHEPEHPRRRDEHDADRAQTPILELDSRSEDGDADEGQSELGPGEPAHGPATPPALGIGGRSSAPASSSGTASTIPRNAAANHLPCACALWR